MADSTAIFNHSTTTEGLNMAWFYLVPAGIAGLKLSA
jgi:hypothetical protein